MRHNNEANQKHIRLGKMRRTLNGLPRGYPDLSRISTSGNTRARLVLYFSDRCRCRASHYFYYMPIYASYTGHLTRCLRCLTLTARFFLAFELGIRLVGRVVGRMLVGGYKRRARG